MAYRLTTKMLCQYGAVRVYRDRELPESAGQWMIKIPAARPSERELFAYSRDEALTKARAWVAPRAPTHASLQAAWDAELGAPEHRALRTEISDIIESGRVNADDTVHVERAAPVSEWESIFIGTVQGALSYSGNSARCIAWFKSHGVTF